MASEEDVEFKPLEDCLEYLDGYKNVDEIKVSVDLEKFLRIIAVHHTKRGLTEEELESLISFAFLKNLKKKTINLLIQCWIPKRVVPKHLVSKVALYVLSSHFDVKPYVTVSLLKWIIGILEYELTDVGAIDELYDLFYFMLQNQNHEIQKYVIRIIYILTHPEDVTEDKIMFISEMELKYGKNKESRALLSLFKCYQPERVPASVPVMEMFDVPQYLPSEVMKNALAEAQKRSSAGSEDTNGVFYENRVPFIKLLKVDDMKPRYCKNVIQTPDYKDGVDRKMKKITEIESVVEVEACWDNLLLPSNVLSILGTEAGLHLLTFGDKTLQLKFAFKVNDTLNKVFVRRTLNASHFEKQLLLERLFELEEYMKQGIVVVSRFLATYLEFWNSVDHRKHILNLIKWVTFTSFAELKEKIILPLYEIFITSEIDFMCEIISALSGLLVNMFEVDVFRSECNYNPLFLNAKTGWISADPGDTLGPTIKSIEHFITVASVLNPKSLQLLLEGISFYELLIELETRSNFAELTIISLSIVYKSLFSVCTTPLTRVCRLLLRYPRVIHSIQVDGSIKSFDRELKLIDLYCADVMNCLWFNQAVSHREAGIIFRQMDQTIIEKINQIVRADIAFSLQNHPMFLPLFVSLVKSDQSLSLPELFTDDVLLTIIDTYFPEIGALIRHKLT